MSNMMFMTDHCAVMLCVVGSTVSQRKPKWNHIWVDCVCHAWNTPMKYALYIFDGNDIKDLNYVKEIVGTFKKNGVDQKPFNRLKTNLERRYKVCYHLLLVSKIY